MRRQRASWRARWRAAVVALLVLPLQLSAAGADAIAPASPVPAASTSMSTSASTPGSVLPHPTGAADDLLDASVPAPLPAWTDAVDFTALRLAYARRRDYDARCEGSPGDAFMPALEAKRFADAAAVAERWLQRCPVDARVHQWAASAYYQAGMQAPFEVHARWHEGLVQSILAGADGLSPASPWRVIAVMEAYVALQHLKLKRVDQAIVEGEFPLDMIEVRDEAGTTATRYFDARWQLRRLRGLTQAPWRG
jgi:hypothetical protein